MPRKSFGEHTRKEDEPEPIHACFSTEFGIDERHYGLADDLTDVHAGAPGTDDGRIKILSGKGNSNLDGERSLRDLVSISSGTKGGQETNGASELEFSNSLPVGQCLVSRGDLNLDNGILDDLARLDGSFHMIPRSTVLLVTFPDHRFTARSPDLDFQGSTCSVMVPMPYIVWIATLNMKAD